MHTQPNTLSVHDRLTGALLGTAVGDAVGLPYEGLSRSRARRFLSDRGLLDAKLIGRQVSDDTEHALMVIRAFARASRQGDGLANDFTVAFARELRRWLLAGPPGVGFATLRGTLKSFFMKRSGAWSAGNGPAMRAAVLGLLAQDEDQLSKLTESSARVTHLDPLAAEGALMVSLAARGVSLHELALRGQDPRLRDPLRTATRLLEQGLPAGALADLLGLSAGVTGYVADTVPVALYCVERHLRIEGEGAFLPAVREAIALGGDTDTVAAIVGGVIGARLGVSAVPRDVLRDVLSDEFLVANVDAIAPLLENVNEPAAATMSERQHRRAPCSLPRWPYWLRVSRNVAFTLLVFALLGRRMLPPY